MVAWHLPLALSQQQADLPNGTLSFAPRLPAPYSLPVLLPGVLGVVHSPRPGEYAVWLTVGELDLQLLSVDGRAAPKTGPGLRLAAGAPPVVW